MHHLFKETPKTKKRRLAKERQRKRRARIAEAKAADVPQRQDPPNMPSTSVLLSQSDMRDLTYSDVDKAKKLKNREKMRAFRARKKEAQDAARAVAAKAFGVLPHPPPPTVASPRTANRHLAGQKRVRDHREKQGEAGRIERLQYSQQWREQQCTPDKKVRLAQKQHRIKHARSIESEHERRLRLEAQTERIKEARQMESKEEGRRRLEAQAKRTKEARQMESEEEGRRRLDAQAERTREARRIESEEEGRRRLDAQAERTREARRTQPNEARDIEREVDRLAHDLARRLESPNTRRRRLDQDLMHEGKRGMLKSH